MEYLRCGNVMVVSDPENTSVQEQPFWSTSAQLASNWLTQVPAEESHNSLAA